MSFASYLEELADPAQPLGVSKLINLSKLDADESSLLLGAWPAIGLERRRQVMERLIDLAEDNVELDFHPVFRIALADDDAGVRRDAIRGLWEYDGRDLIDPLQRMLRNDPDAGVRAEAALALGRFVLRAEFDTLPANEVERVEQALRDTVEDDGQLAEVRGRALESLGARSAPWAQELIERAFASSDRRMRLSAVHAMGRSCDAAWLSTLTRELESDDAEMRFEAANACGAIGDQAALPFLLPLLHDEDPQAQEAAVGALGEVGGRGAREALENLLVDANERVREAALAALAEVDFAEDPLGLRVRSE